MCGVLPRPGEVVTQVIEARFLITLVLFGGAIFLMAFVSSLPRDSRGGAVARRLLHWSWVLVLAWFVARN